ncbi:MAG: hypothetical protein QNJ69_14190 [Gammaproteobacteria bacterium]|nr:hypothetical protein [Gammaproteobacteria bacterium]
MNLYNEINLWLSDAIFWIGVLVVIIGLLFIIVPGQVDRFASRTNKWISTSQFFESLDRHRDQDQFFYLHHRIVGTLIVLCSIYIFNLILVNPGYEVMARTLEQMAGSAFTSWLYPQLLIILVVATFIALFVGVIIFIRPAMLKAFDARVNRWVDTQGKLEVFDSTHSLPEDKVKNNLRFYGVIVFLGGCYITLTIYLAQAS